MSIQGMFPFNNSLVRRILNWRQGDEEDTWRDKAVDSLVKKLKRQSEEQFQNFNIALNHKTENTPCIMLLRSQDGRLQVSHRKMLPHVMYCRIFRWPDLQSQHELRSLPNCQYPAHRREQTRICVNPYHYARVDHSLYPPVVTPRNTEFASASPPPQSPMSPGSNYSSQQPASPSDYFNNSTNSTNSLNNPLALQLNPVPQPAHHQSYQQENPYNFIKNHNNQVQQQPQQQQQQQQHHGQQQSQLSGPGFFSAQSPLSESNWYPASNQLGQNQEPIISPADSPRAVSQQYESLTPPPGYQNNDRRLVPMDTDHVSQQTNTTAANGSEESQEHWCRITYAELNQKIGEPFKGSSARVIVDGFTDPSVHNRRFSLGVLSNINRNSTIEMTRRAIRRGVCLENNDNQIFVKNLSESSIFFHSKNCNVENQLNQHAVVKIEPQGRQKIFDQKVHEDLVQEAIRSGDDKTYERLYSLTEHCMIKMSFVKGWGSIYHRQDVTSTPCWIEIHLLKPFALIDQYIRHMSPPSCQITSTS